MTFIQGDFEATFPWQTMFTKDHVVSRRIDNAVKAAGLFGNRIIQSNYLRALRFVRDEKKDEPSYKSKTHFLHQGFYMELDSSRTDFASSFSADSQFRKAIFFIILKQSCRNK